MSSQDFEEAKPHVGRVEDYKGFEETGTKEADQDVVFEENTEAERKLVRKIDLFLLPCIWIVYLLSYMVGLSSRCYNG
jgi:hypothetical protein